MARPRQTGLPGVWESGSLASNFSFDVASSYGSSYARVRWTVADAPAAGILLYKLLALGRWQDRYFVRRNLRYRFLSFDCVVLL